MGKKAKVGKQRKDKYYRLAKETGYRSRAAFKLVQLNRKFEFLQRSQVVVDLCAAPGGWLQVASEYAPVSCLIIGMDLVPIKTIHNVITLQGDITTESCSHVIKKELKTWEADCVLHDGAPNVGRNWLHDAFSQAQLVLASLKLAVDILRRGGWFITKVFRSKDYAALLTVFKQLFRKVHATKPQASRNESAEIFVVCQGFKKPAAIDPKLLDSKCVFKELQLDPKIPKSRAEGYAEGDYVIYHQCKAGDFIRCENFLEILGRTSEIILDQDVFRDHPDTSREIKECLKDIQVLGRKELRDVLNWRKSMRKHMFSLERTRENPQEQIDLQSVSGEGELHQREEDVLVEEIDQAESEEKAKNKSGELEEDIIVSPNLIIENDDEEKYSPKLLADNWFNQDTFTDIRVQTEEDEDLEIDRMIRLNAKTKEKEKKTHTKKETVNTHSSIKGETDTLSDGGGRFSMEDKEKASEPKKETGDTEKKVNKMKLDAEALALGSVIIHSSKAKRDIIEFAYNRYTNNDENLPEWFAQDERKHYRKPLPVSQELINEYKARQTAINARTIKKVSEAKARKKKRAVRRLVKARKKAESLSENPELTEKEKSNEMRKIYKKAGIIKQKKPVTYVVAKKGGGKRIQRPPGVSGKFKVVDPRMKKDTRRMPKRTRR